MFDCRFFVLKASMLVFGKMESRSNLYDALSLIYTADETGLETPRPPERVTNAECPPPRPAIPVYAPQASQEEGSRHSGDRRSGARRPWLHRYSGELAAANGREGARLCWVAGGTRSIRGVMPDGLPRAAYHVVVA